MVLQCIYTRNANGHICLYSIEYVKRRQCGCFNSFRCTVPVKLAADRLISTHF